MLSGKYENGARPDNARLTLFSRFARYSNPQTVAACSRYVQLAREHGLDPAQMALAFVTRQPFVTSNIIGATSLQQLDSNLASLELNLSADLLTAIEAIHQEQPNRRLEPNTAPRFAPLLHGVDTIAKKIRRSSR